MSSVVASIASALITGILALIGVMITNVNSNKEIENKLTTAQAVTDTKIDNLTEEVKKHTDIVSAIPVLESRLASVERKVDKM